MDAATVVEVAKQGSTLPLLDVLEHTLIGIDTQLVSVGPAFKGIKMIPPGPHYVFYSSSSRDGNDFSPITGFFVCSGTSEVVVRKWDKQQERLVKLPEVEEEERYCQAVRNWEFDKNLGPYNLSKYGEWKRLSSYITSRVIGKLEPIGGEISVAFESSLHKFTPKTAKENALDEHLKTSRFATSADTSNARGSTHQFHMLSNIEESMPSSLLLRILTRYLLRSNTFIFLTQLLESVLQKDYGGSKDLLLGELQFSFVAFLMGQSLEAFLQWKSLVTLLFGCTEAPFHTRSRLFVKFIKVIYYQLKHALKKDSTDTSGASALLDDSWFSADSFLYHLFKEFFLLLQDASVVDGDLLSWTWKLKALLEGNFGWGFEQNSAVDGIHFEEDDEFAPVVVMLDDPGSTEEPR